MDEDQAEFFAERAAILEHDGGHSREQAEALAAAELETYMRRREQAG